MARSENQHLRWGGPRVDESVTWRASGKSQQGEIPHDLLPDVFPGGEPAWARLLGLLSTCQAGSTWTRAEIAEALGMLPRNVHRAVEAANRAADGVPGAPRIEWTIERGRRNQWQYHYVLTRRE